MLYQIRVVRYTTFYSINKHNNIYSIRALEVVADNDNIIKYYRSSTYYIVLDEIQNTLNRCDAE